ncbi:MAG: hypothetical protein M1833_000348 [Piccolia ochrophora]|nr:MAG: hypothetical protein M1833_000348 [Piccolia ochrophora]
MANQTRFNVLGADPPSSPCVRAEVGRKKATTLQSKHRSKWYTNLKLGRRRSRHARLSSDESVTPPKQTARQGAKEQSKSRTLTTAASPTNSAQIFVFGTPNKQVLEKLWALLEEEGVMSDDAIRGFRVEEKAP